MFGLQRQFGLLFVFLSTAVLAQTSCSVTLTASYPTPSVAAGFSARLIANGLTAPRGIIFDSQGHLLVVEQNSGIVALSLADDGGDCLSVSSKVTVINDTSLNHGIEVSNDGATLYASNSDVVYSWAYNASTQKNTSLPTPLVANMSTSDHTTRTLLLSQKVPGTLLVSRGSTENIDPLAEQISSGHSQIRAFNVSNVTQPYVYSTSGTLLGWGLRNSVGVAEHPVTGGIFSIENSADDVTRDNVDIHQNNPGEEMNFHGYLNGTSYYAQGQNYGYPTCFSVWNVSEIPANSNLTVGSPFAIGNMNATVNDTICDDTTIPARLTFQAHWAPLDIKFNTDGTTVWATSHGSWDRTDPTGYLLFAVDFANGQPTEPANSSTAAIPIVSNQDNSKCPDGCFRPVGLAWDSKGRLFMSSDATGEIYVITRNDGSSVNNATLTNSSPPAATSSKAAAANLRIQDVGLSGLVFGTLFWML